MNAHIQTFQHTLLRLWREHWLLRWCSANIVGWSGGIVAATLAVWLFGLWGLLTAGAIAGVIIGTAQALILFNGEMAHLRRRWIMVSGAGAFIGLFPALALLIVGFFHPGLSALLVGGVAGGLLGLCQSFLLARQYDAIAYAWIPVCIAGGALSTWITVPFIQSPVPAICSPASLVFGLITGWFMMWLSRTTR